ncbi:MAG TPA: hypothetical protein PL151_12530 [Phycisphaerae bacterium]|nr:hypothetical protein [Phycisphaerae bacterium]HOJ73563.1 hypothetical protein [Phycisphaerae bacterium]HOM51629.1 hypothetical protein [Phycisphaerae bacterium]HON65395.1 hypothetical protein [Phycisphaerae bacterium]HOQ85377.1 hypothetical protein [Phycisphaerae bacterium]
MLLTPKIRRPGTGRAAHLLLLVVASFITATVRAGIGYGESPLFAIDASTNCAESALLTIDATHCATSDLFVIDNRYAKADFDRDYDVDLDDLSTLLACSLGPGVPCTNDCLHADFDQDGDADQDDFAIFQRCYSGETQVVPPGCAK